MFLNCAEVLRNDNNFLQYLILNLAMAESFQAQDFKHLVFPAEMLIDYVRVYQRRGIKNGVGCNPPNYPTTDYINRLVSVPVMMLSRIKTTA